MKSYRIIKKIELPFGGMQVVFCGDFQLLRLVLMGTDTFWFCSISNLENSISYTKSYCIEENFRQNDPVYTDILQNIRKGAITKNDFNTLKDQVNKQYDAAKHNDCYLQIVSFTRKSRLLQ